MTDRKVITDAGGTKVFVDHRDGRPNLTIYKPHGGQLALRIELKRKDLDALIAELTKMRNQK